MTYKKVIGNLLHLSNLIKIHHWQTSSFARHKATDELYSDFNLLIDRFVEVLNGNIIRLNKQNRISVDKYNSILIDLYNNNDGNILLTTIINFIKSNEFDIVINNNTDLLTIRDEMLELLNKYVYLFSMQ